MNILIADLDQKFIEGVERSWSVPGTNLLVCRNEAGLMPLVKKDSIDLAFIEVPFLMQDNMDMVSFLKEKHPGIEIFVLCDPWAFLADFSNQSQKKHLCAPT